MSCNTKNIHLPVLRFPGFVGEWEEKTIGDIADVLQGFGFPDKYQGQTTGDLPFCKVGDISAAVDKGERIISHAANYVDYSLLPELHARPIPEGATLFAKIGEAIRSNKRIMTGCPCLIDNNAAAVKAKEGESDEFIFYLMSNVNLADYAGGIVPSVNKSTIETISVLIPPTIAEQKKIASCLLDIDSLIAAQSQIIAAVKEKKKGLIQQLFPLPGENTPRLRFPGFTGEWQEKPLSHFLHEHKTKSDGKCEVHSVSVTKGVINQVEYLGRSFAASNTSKYNLAKPGDIIYTKSPTGAFPYGIVKQNKNPYNVIVSPLYAVYTPLNQYVGYILDSYFESPVNTNNYLSSLIQKGAKNTIQISNDTFVSKSMCLPSNPAEQQKIAKCLESLDSLIASETKKLESLKTHKRGLMQQLFPQPNK
jgi:type I restriction enzyme S subunit